MKKFKLIAFALFGLILFASFDAAAQSDRRQDYTALYRLYNSQSGDHLYTTDCDEKDDAVSRDGYKYESVTGYVATRQVRRSVPLYRMQLKSGEHFYTIDRREMDDLMRDGANKSEGIVGYVSSSQQRGTQPLYRLVLDNSNFHLYTTDEREKNNLQNSGGRLESVAGYVWTSGSNFCDYAGGTSDYPVVYSGTDFTGAAKILEGDWNVSDDWDGSPNAIGSIRVPRGWYVVIYRKENFRGESYDISTDAAFAGGNRWRNRIRSIKVYKGNPPR